ncbi:cytochrome b [Methylosinus sp. C49]|uniref:cytochrome b n=1 Tax=Methylosinus sp. C49 TaxID=2699395 RepID=UPI001366983C|nr:cytochrome b/b6 domain-containing protein [Methylosinus sp. C49]BBU62692.1 cytochrome b [Methylosinus sp. C49]
MVERQPYSPLAKTLHWIIAALALTSLPTGVVMADLDKGPLQDNLFVLHESIGVIVLALMVPRLLARLRRRPGSSADLTPAERLVSKATHRGLYLLLIATPIVGWLALSAYGLGPSFFWLGHLPALLGKDEPLSKQLFELHEFLGWVLLALIALHIAGVIRHRIAGDEVVWRMLPEAWRK